jgi:hypothetical protein
MSSDNREEKPEQHSENKGQQSDQSGIWAIWHRVPRTQRIIAESAVLTLYFIFEAHSTWPESHGWALFKGALGTCVVLAIEMPLKWWIPTCAAVGIGASVIYWVAGPTSHLDTEVIGTLQPGSEPTPPNNCPATGDPDTWKIMIGTATIQFTGPVNSPLLMIGDYPVLTIDRDDKGVSVSADLFDTDGKSLATIKNNVFHAISGANSWVERDHDLSKLIIMAGDPREILFVHYLNKSTVRVRGVFSYPGHMTIAIKDNEPLPGIHMAAGVCSNVLRGVTFKSFMKAP